jgi:hypothetical protein
MNTVAAVECLRVRIPVLYCGKYTGLSVLIKYKAFLLGSRRLSSRLIRNGESNTLPIITVIIIIIV